VNTDYPSADESRGRLRRAGSSRWWLVTLTVLVLGFTALWSLFTLAHRPRRLINRESFGRLEAGMTRPEVQAVLRLPPGDFTVFKRRLFLTRDVVGGDAFDSAEWASDAGMIEVVFTRGKAVELFYHEGHDLPDRDLLDALGRLLPGRR